MDSKNIISLTPAYLRRNAPDSGSASSTKDLSRPQPFIGQKSREDINENWRKTDKFSSTSDRKEWPVRRNRDDLSNQKYNRSGTTINRNFNQNKKKNFNQMTDDEFITELLSIKDILEVANAVSNTQRFVKIVTSNPGDDLLVKILQLVARLFDATQITNQNFIIKCIMQQKFVKQLNLFLSMLAVSNDKEPKFWHEFDNVLKNIITILDNVLNLMPMTMWGHVKSVVQNINIVITALKSDKPVTISNITEELLISLRDNIEKIENIFKKPEDKTDIVSEDQTEIETALKTNYRTITTYPDITELIIRDRPYLRKNIVDKPYTSIAQYLDIHFRLLREDFINPIREDICDYMNKTNRRFFNIKIYKNTKFLERVLLQDKSCFKLSFNVPEWISKSLEKKEQLKRFIHGTMLLFTHDNFDTMLCGKVANCDELKNGCIVVEMLNCRPDLEKIYLMLECIIFFEPYYQVLSVLKYIHPESLPMEDYIIHIKKDAKPPQYMESLPIPKVNGLNASQEAALNAAMSKEFVIIQGPPGTGKTFLGMTIIKEILELKQHWHYQGPILIICFTNHALDQFLNGLRSNTQRIARLGGQSNSLKYMEEMFGPEAEVREKFNDLTERLWCDKDEKEEALRLIIKNLKRGFSRDKLYDERFEHVYTKLLEQLSVETKGWLKKKGEINRWVYDLKTMETSIKKSKQTIKNLDSFSSLGIFTANFLFDVPYAYYYYFTDWDLLCWLLCDDGSIQTEVETVQNVGLVNRYDVDEPSKIYSLLSDCFNEREWMSQEGVFALSVDTLRNYLYELENSIQFNQYEESLLDYIQFVKRKIDYLRICLNTNFDFPEDDIINVNPWTLSSKSRWQLYGQWIDNKKRAINAPMEEELDNYQTEFNMYKRLREEDNIKLLKTMDIIGMTTTCAARMRSTLEHLRSPIVIVEEAAEVLESHIVTALTNNCQHLILLGDHQQLRPATSDYNIEKDFKLGISLFERMVNNNVECHTLNVQHRMRPEISKLLKPTFYKDLQDSESVMSYPMVTGITCPLYFIDHTEPEEPYGDSSKMNMHEAKYLIQLAIYLLNNDYLPEDITILAAYLGQTHILKEEREKSTHPLIHKVHITPVDNYQGEENKIILLSLVRSNVDNRIGFLKVDNRVCVALSRAREGFYIMGNMVQLCASSEIWKPINASLQSQNAIGKFLSVHCRNHVDFVTLVLKPSDFEKVPEGGCGLECNKELLCGHKCNKKCHGYDLDHQKYLCREPCTKSICDIPEHKCKKLCMELCGECYYLVEKTLPCGHKTTVACSAQNIRCKQLVEAQHDDCKHTEVVECFKTTEGKFDCMVQVEKQLPCGHQNSVPCHVEAKDFQCLFEVEVQLACSHSIKKKCHQDVANVTCNNLCQKEMKCGHVCPQYCHKDYDPEHLKIGCEQPCSKPKAGCNHPDKHPKCTLRCKDICVPCTVVTFSSQTCTHLKRVQCYEEQSVRCHKQCSKKLPCGHVCPNECYESCEKTCLQKSFKIIPECGHRIKLECYKTPQQSMCDQSCSKLLPCGHNCKKLCSAKCTEDCLEACKKELECAHRCIKLCREPCACKREKYPECDHHGYVKCGDILKKEDCKTYCRKQLECGHRCLKKCGEQCKCTNTRCMEMLRKRFDCELWIDGEDIHVLVDIPHDQPNPEYGKNYTMIECVLFFEPYHQVLSVLQKLNEKSLPMENYILKISTKACLPQYMENVKEVAEIEGLNPSQEVAYRAAMTREFVIIQGPPGTGKTFIGMKIVEEIIKLRECWQHQGPILIICFTNHALDQFINGLKGATDRIARLGGKNNTTFKDLAAKFGPETLILDFLEEHLKYERDYYEKHGFFCGVRCNPDCDYLEYKEFVKMLKNKRIFLSNPFKDLLKEVPEDVRKWIEAKKVLGYRFFEIKQSERGIRRNHKKLHLLNTLRPNVIFKTDFLFDDSCDNMYYYFDDFELACWLLCDDGSITSKMDTLETVGLRFHQKYDEPSKVYGLLSDCIKERDLNDWKVQSILTVESLKDYANHLEEYLKNYPNQKHLREYLNFVNDKVGYFQTCLSQDFGPPEIDIANYSNPFVLSSQQRWKLYNHWIETKRKAMKRELDVQMDAYGEEFFALNVLREEDNVRLLKRMDIVGMTTTCAAKMRSILEGLKNPIVVVEEAAEVLESHIIAALTENCQHLILVGDHQQLRPTTSDYIIETKFNLGISLFERMVINDVQCHTLNVQHRMRPDIADLIRPNFYRQLLDSDSVKLYPDVTGISRNLYFIDHNYPEEPYLDSSKMNRHEAEFLIQLTVYLLNNDYKPEEITILAAYLGQTYILRQERDKCSHRLIKQVRITPVDNFQGEENRIILLSLVRSNADNNIGFLAVDNRVVVALSRAREGFYFMGNMDLLCKATEIWKPVKATLEFQNSLGKALPLCCRNHKDHVTHVSKPSDFSKVPEGGCNQACDKELNCGHRCKRKCHGTDIEHENYVCHEPCFRSLCEDPDHKCGKICFEECGTECVYPVPKVCDICHEETMIECSKLEEEFRCETLIDTLNAICLHYKGVPCYLFEDYDPDECDVEQEYKLPCGHLQMIPCNVEKEAFKCQFDIKVKLSCGHEVTKKCHRDVKEVICQKNCGKMLECGHTCFKKCHISEDPDHKTYKCVQPCLKSKSGCNHTKDHPKCSLACWETCETCTVETISLGENCTHLNRGLCHAEKSRRCYKRCNKKLPCGHNCRKQCYDTCGICYQKTFKIIPECGHKIKVSCKETVSQSNCRKICQKKLSCGHQCTKLCKDECIQVCNEKCNKVLECGHNCTKLCNEECLETCSQSCKKVLKCGHKCIKSCKEECACKTVKYRLCDHFCDTKCGETLKPTCEYWECLTAAFLKMLNL